MGRYKETEDGKLFKGRHWSAKEPRGPFVPVKRTIQWRQTTREEKALFEVHGPVRPYLRVVRSLPSGGRIEAFLEEPDLRALALQLKAMGLC